MRKWSAWSVQLITAELPYQVGHIFPFGAQRNSHTCEWSGLVVIIWMSFVNCRLNYLIFFITQSSLSLLGFQGRRKKRKSSGFRLSTINCEYSKNNILFALHSKLECLDLVENQIGDNGAIALSHSLPRLGPALQ